MGDNMSLNKAFRQTQKMKVVKAAAGTPLRLTMRQVTGVPVGTQLLSAKYHRVG
jgi:hypothetical protein